MISGATLGRISRMMMRRSPKPSSCAADTKSLRAHHHAPPSAPTRQKRVQSTSTIDRMTLPTPVPKPDHQRQRQHHRRQRHPQIDQMADDAVDPAAEIAGEQVRASCRAASRRWRRRSRPARRRARHRSFARGCSGRDCRCRTDIATCRPRYHIGGSSMLMQVLVCRIVRRDLRREQRTDHHDARR